MDGHFSIISIDPLLRGRSSMSDNLSDTGFHLFRLDGSVFATYPPNVRRAIETLTAYTDDVVSGRLPAPAPVDLRTSTEQTAGEAEGNGLQSGTLVACSAVSGEDAGTVRSGGERQIVLLWGPAAEAIIIESLSP
ncbi:hypothetical protein ACQP2X_34310 [Actinoplanes sp. CA-131856]